MVWKVLTPVVNLLLRQITPWKWKKLYRGRQFLVTRSSNSSLRTERLKSQPTRVGEKYPKFLWPSQSSLLRTEYHCGSRIPYKGWCQDFLKAHSHWVKVEVKAKIFFELHIVVLCKQVVKFQLGIFNSCQSTFAPSESENFLLIFLLVLWLVSFSLGGNICKIIRKLIFLSVMLHCFFVFIFQEYNCYNFWMNMINSVYTQVVNWYNQQH